MKPKEIIYKAGIVNGVNARNQDYFLDLMILELKCAYEEYAKDDSEKHFTAAVKETRSKWDAISNKISYGLPEGLWRYFYARIMNYKKRVCPTWAKVQEREHEKYLERQKRRKQIVRDNMVAAIFFHNHDEL